MNKKISLEELMQWTNNKEKSSILLSLSILDQKITGIFKQGELLESLEEGNQQPSLNSNILEGSTTNNSVQTNNVEDDDIDKSALPGIGKECFKIVFKDNWINNFNISDDIVWTVDNKINYWSKG